MIDLSTEQKLLSLEQARHLPLCETARGGAPSFATILRWVENGRGGVKLAGIYKPSGWHTSELAIIKFFEELTAAKTGQPKPSSEKQRQRSFRAAEQFLIAAGM